MSVDRSMEDEQPWPVERAPSRSDATRPEDDPFYAAPDGYEAAPPGTILKVRPVEVAMFGRVRQRVDAWQLLYRTADLGGYPQASVTTVLRPRDAEPVLLSYQCAIDGVASSCFPSYALRRGSRAFGAVPQFEFLLVLHALRRGWTISIPDHEGPDGHWGSPQEPGFCTLDAIRAALSFEPLELNDSTPVALWGYSGGGLATSWAAEMAPEYAPEIELVGAALGSPVGDPGSAFTRLNATLHAALPTLVVAGLRRTYPELDRVIRQHVDEDGMRILDSVESMTTVRAVTKLARHDLDHYIDVPLADLLALPEIVQVFLDIQPGRTAPTAPLLVIQSVHDQIIAVDDVDGQVDRYIEAGAHVTYLRDRLSEHLSLHPIGAPLTLNWLSDRFAGVPVEEPSTRTVWSIAFSFAAVRGLLSMTWTTIRALVGGVRA
ncbi:lipase [Rhodococcus sp. IEGM 1401]|uniref:Lipase family protein n=1 Tax=Rhodococcus cerastii TaxID=908616 RepID=A0ABU4D211_9NOCA|nr:MULTISPECIES: lipase family protein [Rhodococcus]MCZ4563174.1 lipase [Rhodococcus sp. IEGM 1401]MDI9923268.1 lipase family protein [Rhodococcus sp. IEGM 1372]MDV6303166.1 lipase family protein [Rhodococcus cerastii]MDV8034826.1 lipase family protein [Rhodococcus sp. IEGM 1414]MDV8077082.1 lipase family protein [Rhodococcus sp. IEGM 1370]